MIVNEQGPKSKYIENLSVCIEKVLTKRGFDTFRIGKNREVFAYSNRSLFEIRFFKRNNIWVVNIKYSPQGWVFTHFLVEEFKLKQIKNTKLNLDKIENTICVLLLCEVGKYLGKD